MRAAVECSGLAAMVTKYQRVVLATLWVASTTAFADPGQNVSRRSVSLELAAAWQERNDVQIPNDSKGTRFALDDVVGEGPVAVVRAEAVFPVNESREWRVVVAPFSYQKTGELEYPVEFVGASYAAGVPTTVTYRFDSYRLTHRWLLKRHGAWSWRAGATLKVRDAEIALRQGATHSADSNVGLVPLLHLNIERALMQRGWFVIDADGLAAPQGRAFDISLKLGMDINDRSRATVGYRLLDGGVDNESVYNFARFNYVVAGLDYKF